MTTLSLFTIEACTRRPDRMTPESLVSAMCKNIWDIWMHAWYQKCFQGSDGVGFGMAQSDNSVGRGGGGPMIILVILLCFIPEDSLDLPFRSTI